MINIVHLGGMTCSEQTENYFRIMFAPVSSELERLGEVYPNGETQEACEAFTGEVNLHKATVKLAYRHVVTCLKGASDLDVIVKCWDILIRFIDRSTDIVRGLKERFPYCGTPELYNELLEYRNAASKRRDQALEERECIGQLPEGLFADA